MVVNFLYGVIILFGANGAILTPFFKLGSLKMALGASLNYSAILLANPVSFF